MKKRILSVLLSLVMLVGLLSMAALAATAPEEADGKWTISKSKTATPLDKDYRSQVTLSLPSAEEELSSDIVFVLDTSDCVGEVMGKLTGLVNELEKAQETTKAQINIGVVAFKGSAAPMFDGKMVKPDEAITELTKLAKDVAAAGDKNAKEAAVVKYLKTDDRDFINKGSNLHAGLEAAQEMLDGDTKVAPERKYMIAISDCITYYWNDDEDNVYGVYSCYFGDSSKEQAGLLFEGWTAVYGVNEGNGWVLKENSKLVNDWNGYLNGARERMAQDGSEYWTNIRDAAKAFGKNYSDVRFSTTTELKEKDFAWIPYGEIANHAVGMDYSIVNCVDTYQAMAKAGYQCYTVITDYSEGTFPYLMGAKLNELGGKSESINFNDIHKDILYAVDAGSRVEDYMGYEKDNYDFDLVDLENMKLSVGEDTYDAKKISDNVYGFKEKDNDYAFKVEYERGNGKDEEHFVWHINEPISNFNRVQLTYTVQLMNPKTEPGTYNGLYTNNSAILYPHNTSGDEGAAEEFPKPTVSYTVGASGGILVLPPVLLLNTEDHVSYLIGYADGTIRPEGKITRGEVATIFFRLLTNEARERYWSQTNSYSDVTGDLWCNNAISTLSGMDIIDGYNDGTFRPNAPITRAEFAKIAVGFYKMDAASYQGTFTDVADGKWYTPYVEAAAQAGLIYGDHGKFRPDENITRAEASAIVNRLLDRHPHKDHLLPSYQMITWPDCGINAWYYADMMEATNSHSYTRMQTASYVYGAESWTGRLKQPDWTALERSWSDARSVSGGEVR